MGVCWECLGTQGLECDGKWEVYRQGLIEGTAAFILIRTNLDKLATAANT